MEIHTMDMKTFKSIITEGPLFNADIYNSISPYTKALGVGTIFEHIANNKEVHELVNSDPENSMYRIALYHHAQLDQDIEVQS